MEPRSTTPIDASERAVSFSFLKEFIQKVPKDFTTGDVVFKLIVPATIERKCFYTSLVDPKQVSKPNYFVSHRWGSEFHFIFERIQYFMERHQELIEDTTFFWIDIFAINQHPGEEQQADLSQLATAVSLSDKTLLCMDKTGLVLTRIWCLYEIWKTITLKGDASRLLILMKDLDQSQVGDIFLKFHVDKAQATVDSDRVAILKDINQGIGAQQMTEMIKKTMLASSLADVTSLTKSKGIPNIIESLLNCAYLHYLSGDLKTSEEKSIVAVELAQKNLEKDHLLTASALNSLAAVFAHQKKLAKAEKLYREALAIRKKVLNEHSGVSSSMTNLAAVLDGQRKFAEAEQLQRGALALDQKLTGGEDSSVANDMNNLAVTLKRQGKHSEAIGLLQDTVALKKKLYGEEHPSIATSYTVLADIYIKQGKYSEAEELFIQALALRKRFLGDGHPIVSKTKRQIEAVQKQKEKQNNNCIIS